MLAMAPCAMVAGILRMSRGVSRLKFLPRWVAEMKFEDEPRELVAFDPSKIVAFIDTGEVVPPRARPWESRAEAAPTVACE